MAPQRTSTDETVLLDRARAGDRIAAVTAFLTPWVSEMPPGSPGSAEIFARFGLPAELT
jgi:hypothetical protein